MKNLTISSLTLMLLFAFTFTSAQSLRGAWERDKVVVTNQEGENVLENTQPSIWIFMNKYYSVANIRQENAREAWPEGTNRNNATVEQWKEMVLNYVSNAGTYSVEGNKIITKPTIALNQGYMGQTGTYEFERKGNQLMLHFSGGEGETAWKAVEYYNKVE